jgi:TonB family protein
LTPGKWWKNSVIVNDLGLSENQVQQLEEVYLKHQSRLADLRNALSREEEQLRGLLNTEPLDEKSLIGNREKIIAARGNLERENSEMTIGLRKILKAEQWKMIQIAKVERAKAIAPPPPPPPPPPTDKSGQWTVGEKVYDVSKTPGIQAPIPTEKPLPAYTPEAREKGIQGIVLMQVLIDKDGRVTDAKVLRSLEHSLDLSALNTVKDRWRFKPGMLDGKPVNVKAVIEVSFRLQ